LIAATVSVECGAGVCALEDPMMREKVGLTQEQSEKLDKLFYEHHLRMIDLEADLKKKELAFERAKSAKNLDEKEIRRAAAEVLKAREAIFNEGLFLWLEVMKLLTPEQRMKFIKMSAMAQGMQVEREVRIMGAEAVPCPMMKME
ncbi:MAG: periplasmic heavy metal sensor, partial [candidate division WOR-3 bacterium]